MEQPTSDEIARLVEADKLQRRDAVAARIQQALAEYRCELQAHPAFTTSGTIVAQITIVPL